ncbi:MAG TPA: c-type cytochrome [Chitinophagaceae bacterium]|nr:c-type cytochrome [Chitinophagaceae bacterium]
MKKVVLVFAVMTALYACGGGSTESSTPVSNNEENKNSQIGGEAATTPAAPADTAAAAPAPAAAPATAAASGKDGKALIEASDCRTCHQDAAKVIGPAYQDVAKKYPSTAANVKMLAGKVIAGGKGVWGEIPMTPHPNVTQADAEAMVTYILSMKK